MFCFSQCMGSDMSCSDSINQICQAADGASSIACSRFGGQGWTVQFDFGKIWLKPYIPSVASEAPVPPHLSFFDRLRRSLPGGKEHRLLSYVVSPCVASSRMWTCVLNHGCSHANNNRRHLTGCTNKSRPPCTFQESVSMSAQPS